MFVSGRVPVDHDQLRLLPATAQARQSFQFLHLGLKHLGLCSLFLGSISR